MTQSFASPSISSDDPATQGVVVGTAMMDLILYTEAYMVRGSVPTQHRRLSDVLNAPGDAFLVVEQATLEAYGSRDLPQRAGFAQVNLAAVLFAVDSADAPATPDLHAAKMSQGAFISLPPWQIFGQIHLLPDRDLRAALAGFTARFVPVTGARYWSERLGEPSTPVGMLAFNHARAQILAPYEERDVWGMPMPGASAAAD